MLEVEGRVAGYALLVAFWSNEYGGEVCCVDELYVVPGARGRGFGSALFEGIGRLWGREPVAVALEVRPENTRALSLYRRLGFSGKNIVLRRR